MPGRTFGQRLTGGLAGLVLLAFLIGALGIYAVVQVAADKDYVIRVQAERLLRIEAAQADVFRKTSAGRGYLLTGSAEFLREIEASRAEFRSELEAMAALHSLRNWALPHVQAIRSAEEAHQAALQALLTRREAGSAPSALAPVFDTTVMPRFAELSRAMNEFSGLQRARMEEEQEQAERRSRLFTWSIVGLWLALGGLAAGLALHLGRTLTQEIGRAVSDVQSASTELQTSARQQATASKEQSTSLSEIGTTIRELLATSQQISESAQRVAGIADETREAAHEGEGAVQSAQSSVETMRRQVDQLIAHMLELGKKSQHVGGILDIINELSEQTNILAINATIEAVGAGESGRRFAVVADEIRKLADRVGGSARDIRVVVDEIRAAVNSSVMATESGSKAVETGARRFRELARSFERIVAQVETTQQAVREIELSTKQQSSAVEQVNLAVADVMQAARETESSSVQTLQTSGQLAGLSTKLLRLIRPEGNVG